MLTRARLIVSPIIRFGSYGDCRNSGKACSAFHGGRVNERLSAPATRGPNSRAATAELPMVAPQDSAQANVHIRIRFNRIRCGEACCRPPRDSMGKV